MDKEEENGADHPPKQRHQNSAPTPQQPLSTPAQNWLHLPLIEGTE
ncbi:hypothetical protein A2U01_0053956, partial [Trifolium medium]|nr:hypothetical protein [Trifolium medium]